MPDKYRHKKLAVLFAAVAGLAAFAFVPHKVDVTVTGIGEMSDGVSTEHYIATDRGRAPVSDTSDFYIGPPMHRPYQRATCVQHRDALLHTHLQDCKPR